MVIQRGKPVYQIKIAKERIIILFDEAKKRPDFAKRYVELAKKIGMRYNVRLEGHKRKFCKYCSSYFIPKNSTTRMKNGILNVTCKDCNKTNRFPYK